MKTFLISQFLFFTIANLAFSQWVSQFNTDKYLEDILFIDENTGFVTSNSSSFSPYSGGFYMTTNGGSHWIILDSINNSTVDLQYIGNKLFCFCDFGIFLETTNSGQSWEKKSHPIQYLYSAHFINETTGWIGSGGSIARIYKTTNGGVDWNQQYVDSIQFSYLKSLYFLDELTGIATEQVFPTTNYSGKIIKTTNGGEDWKIVYQGGYDDRFLWDVSYNGNTFYAVDSHFPNGRNNVLLSTDQGDNWISSSSLLLKEYSNSLISVNFVDTNLGFITGDLGVVYKTSDGGSSWIKLKIPDVFVTRNSYFLDANTGWIIGNVSAFSYSSILKTTNGGLDIATKPFSISPSGNINYDTIRFRWHFSFYATSYHVQIATDTAFSNPIDTNFIVDDFVLLENFSPNTTYYWRVMANGEIGNSEWSFVHNFTVITSSIEPVNNSIPSSLDLFQNYPNPFNPVTKIKFSVPESQVIKMKVYDIQGKEIQQLLNERVQAGNYETEFDGNNFSSGIYYYTLESESFRITKKMLLIK